MKRISIPGTGLEVSRLGYGCMNLGGSWDDSPPTGDLRKRAFRIIETALDAGITLFDHADIYCCGKSEELFGEFLQQQPGLRSRIIIQTKCGICFADRPSPGDPPRYDLSRRHILASVESSLRRLRTDYLDILLLHRPDPLAGPGEIAEAFDALQQSGKCRFFGVSNYSAAQMRRLQAVLDHRLAVNQIELSLLRSELVWNGVIFNTGGRSSGEPSLDSLSGCPLIQAWGPLAQGKLCGADPAFSDKASSGSESVASIARELGVSREAILLAWLLRLPYPVQPILGTTNPERLLACTESLGLELTRQHWYELLQTVRGEEIP